MYNVEAWPYGFTFLLTPLREGRLVVEMSERDQLQFLLTPLREGRRAIPA